MDPRAKDTKLRWEIIALAKQITCLIAEPEKFEHNDRTMVPEFGQAFDKLVTRVQASTLCQDSPTQQEYLVLLGETQGQLNELIMLQLEKHRRWCLEQSESHWSDEARTFFRGHSAYLLDCLTKMAQGQWEEVGRQLSQKPPIIATVD